MCKFTWEWIYAKRIAPRDTRGVLGGQQFKSMGKLSEWHQLWFPSADSSGNGHMLNTSRPSIPRVAFGGGVRVSPTQKSGEAVKRLDRLAPNLEHICIFIWERIYAKQIAPRDTRGHLEGFRGHTLKTLGKQSNGWTDWHQLWFTSADLSGNRHRLNPSRPSIPQGHLVTLCRRVASDSGRQPLQLLSIPLYIWHIVSWC